MSKNRHHSSDPSRGHTAGSVAEPVGGFNLGPGFLERVTTLESEVVSLKSENTRLHRWLAVTRSELSAAMKRLDRMEHPKEIKP